MHHGTSSVSHPGSFLKTLGGMRVDSELVRSGWQLSTVHDGRLSAARNMEGWRGRGAEGCQHSQAYNTWEVMWSRSGVKIVECEKGEEEHEEHKEECKEHEWDSHSLCSSPSLQYNCREDREVTAE